MLTFMTILIAIVSILLILIVIVQNPKGGGIDSTFGGGAANQMFGAARSTELIERVTWILAAILFALCIISTIMLSSSGVDTTPLITE